MTMAGGSEKQWRTDGIEPTYTTGTVFAWLLASRIELECEVDTPLVAWTLLVDHKSKSRRTLLGTFHLDEFGGLAQFNVWQLSAPGGDGRLIATVIDRDLTRHYIPYREHPYNPRRDGASEVICALYETAVERGRTESEFWRILRGFRTPARIPTRTDRPGAPINDDFRHPRE
jgi:hypothetical protein